MKYVPGARLGGKLSYVGPATQSPGGATRIEVRCDCGIDFVCQQSNVRTGNTTQCKTCSITARSQKALKPDTHTHQLFVRYRNQAKARGLSFELDEPTLTKLVCAPCHYCGIKASANLTINGRPFPYNGIDRVHNETHYREDNCVPCCIWCNTAKGAKPIDEWLSWIARIHNRHNQEKPDVTPVPSCGIQRSAPWGKTGRLPSAA